MFHSDEIHEAVADILDDLAERWRLAHDSEERWAANDAVTRYLARVADLLTAWDQHCGRFEPLGGER